MPHLYFESDNADDDGILYGRVCIGNLDEGFGATAGPWTAVDYRSQWREALHVALGGEDAALIVDWRPTALPTGVAGQAFCLYWTSDGALAIQNRLLLNTAFTNPANPSPSTLVIGPGRVSKHRGRRISEWFASRSDLEALLQTLL